MEQQKPIQYPLLDPQIQPGHPQYSHYHDNAQEVQQFPNPISHGVNQHYNVAVQPPHNQALTKKCQELTNEIQSYNSICTLHWVYNAFWMVLSAFILLFIALVMIFGSGCFGHGSCFSSTGDYLVLTVIVMISLAALLIHRYCFCAFYYKRWEQMRYAYVIYVAYLILNLAFVIFLLSLALFTLVNVGILGYLAYTAAKLVNLHRALALARSQLAGDAHSSVAF